MRREARVKSEPALPKVTQVALNEKHLGKRLIVVLLLLAIAVTAFVIFFRSFVSVNNGWRTVSVKAGAEAGCSGEFQFQYEFGVGGASATAEYKQISALYTEASYTAYRLFESHLTFPQGNNLHTLNVHPNEVIQVEDVLYRALETMAEDGGRYLYLAPLYEDYRSLFACTDDAVASSYDPALDAEQKAYAERVLAYACDPEQINVELLGDGQVRLFVSEDYLAYAEEVGITTWIDFFWLKNAFILDYFASVMRENGFTHGSITSYDGYGCTLDTREDVSYAIPVPDLVNSQVITAGEARYTGACSLVNFRNFPSHTLDQMRFYTYSDGTVRGSYVDTTDGCAKAALPSLTVYAADLPCAQLALAMAPVYLADSWDDSSFREHLTDTMNALYCRDRILYYTDPSLTFNNLYDSLYTIQKME